jgi:hypothetical protein
MKAFYCTILTPIVFACNQAPTSDQQITTEQATNKDSVTIAVADSSEISKKQKTFDMSLNGPWTDGYGENATFSIDDNKIFFVEHLTTEKLFMKGDTAMVYSENTFRYISL